MELGTLALVAGSGWAAGLHLYGVVRSVVRPLGAVAGAAGGPAGPAGDLSQLSASCHLGFRSARHRLPHQPARRRLRPGGTP